MTINTNNPFADNTVVATGRLVNYTRDGIQMKLLSLGATPASSVTKKTDYIKEPKQPYGYIENKALDYRSNIMYNMCG